MVINSFRLNLTLPGQRMAIARDILVQLKSKLFVPSSGNLVDLSKPWFTKRDTNPRRLLEMLTSNSTLLTADVDVLGAIFLSIVKLAEMEVESTENSDPDAFNIEDVEDVVNEIYDWEQIRLLEIAFESGLGLFVPQNEDERVAAAIYYHSSNKLTLKNIMQNVLDNDGTFVIPSDIDERSDLLDLFYDEIEGEIVNDDYDLEEKCDQFCYCVDCSNEEEEEEEEVCDDCDDMICSCEEDDE